MNNKDFVLINLVVLMAYISATILLLIVSVVP